MIQHEQIAQLLVRTITANDFNEQVISWVAASAPIKVIISYRSGAVNLSNDVQTTNYTITGLTYDNRAKEQDKIKVGDKTYLITTIIETGRRRLMALTEDRDI